MAQYPYEEKIPKPRIPEKYHIEVAGKLDQSWSDRLGGMRIATRNRKDQTVVSILTGQLTDQGALVGILSSLYEMRFPLQLVKKLSEMPNPEKSKIDN